MMQKKNNAYISISLTAGNVNTEESLYQSYTFPYENPPFLGSQKFDFIGLTITILAAKPQVTQHT